MQSSSLLSKVFSKWTFSLWLVIVLTGVFLFLKIPSFGYESLLDFISHLLQQKYGSGGSKVKIDNGFHKLSVLLMALGTLLFLYFYFWKWLLKSAATKAAEDSRYNTLIKLQQMDWALMLGCILLGIILRMFPLTQSLWQDEIGVYNTFIKDGITSTIFPKSSMGSQPLMQISVGLFSSIFGSSEIALRFPLFVFALAGIGFMYYFTLQITKKRSTAFLASFLLCLHSYHIYYSFQMRGYVMLVFLCLLSCYYLFQLLRNPNKSVGTRYTLVGILLVYTHLYAVYLLIAQQLVILLFELYCRYQKNQTNSRFSFDFLSKYFHTFVITMLISVLLYLPQLPVIFMNILDTVQAKTTLSIYFTSVLDSLNFMLAYSTYPQISFGVLLIILIVFVVKVEQSKEIKLLGAIALALFFITALVPSGSGFFPRYLICEIPLLMIILAHSIENLWSTTNYFSKSVSILLMVGFLFLNISGYSLSYQKIQDYKGAVSFVENYSTAKPKVIVSNSLGKTEVQHYNANIIALNHVSELDSLLNLDIELFAITTYESFAGRSVFKNDKATQEKIESNFFHEKVFPGEFPVNVWHYKKKQELH